jgi:hypothetical protein
MLTGALGFTSQPLFEAQFIFGAAVLALTIYASQQLTLVQLLQKDWQRWLVAGGIAVLILGALFPALREQQRHTVQNYAFLRELAADPEDYLVLHYPFGLTGLANQTVSGQHAELSRYALWHQKRTPNGVALYYDSATFSRFSEQQFLFLNQLSADDTANAASQLGEAVRTWRIGYVIVHPELLSQSEIEMLDSLAVDSEALCPAFEQEGLHVYRALWHPAGCEEPLYPG